MSNALYGKGKEKLLASGNKISVDTDTIKVALIDNAYTPDLVNHEWWSDISAHLIGAVQALGSKTFAQGVFDAADTTFPAVAAGSTAKYVAIYKDTGAAGTSPLLALLDTITGFPLATNGGDITVQWDNGTYRIFSL